ncbi:MAG: putative tRNA pseudouridine synthase D [Methanocella sp. PtaU1.Bin125]|nr:MAG: putative tRNA pseudouridine synthase D [Methanocella sp. PtaU1.Bin125]
MRDSPYELERLMGIGAYLTDADGIGGRLRNDVADFVVDEISDVKAGETGDCLIVRVVKENWETHHLLRDMARQLGISDDRIGIAGIKDKRAVTSQLMSIRGAAAEDLSRITLPRVSVTPLGRSNKDIAPGDLKGNDFDILISDIDIGRQEMEKRVSGISAGIAAAGGVPNFFGYQRFGIRRPVTHLVGERIVKGDIEGAAMTYIARSFPWESQASREVRDAVWKTRDFRSGLETYPLNLRYERAMMHRLVERPGDYAGAFRALPGNLISMFVHAYQSYLFNRILSQRMKTGLSLTVPGTGDVVCFSGPGGEPDPAKIELVTAKNRPDVLYLQKRRRAFLVLPLAGRDTKPEMIDETARTVFEAEGVALEGFEIEQLPELTSAGRWREAVTPVSPVIVPEETALRAKFFLRKGSYATTVLREYMKVDPVRMD